MLVFGKFCERNKWMIPSHIAMPQKKWENSVRGLHNILQGIPKRL